MNYPSTDKTNTTDLRHLLKNFRRLNEPELDCAAAVADEDDECDEDDADFWLNTCLASRSRCFMSRSRCFCSRSSAALMSFSRFFSWSRSLLELTPRDFGTHHTTHDTYCFDFRVSGNLQGSVVTHLTHGGLFSEDFITIYNEPHRETRPNVQKIGWDLDVWFLRYACGQTNKQTNRQTDRHADHNTLHP